MYIYDTHVHTKETSACSLLGAEELVRAYKKNGFSGFVVTDHFMSEYFDHFGNADWREKVNRFFTGYYKAKEIGEKIDFTVLCGLELRLDGFIDDYLVYGLTPEVMYELRDLHKTDFDTAHGLIKQHGGIMFLAHPFRGMRPLCKNTLFDGVEVHNGSPRHKNYNDLALEFADKKKYRQIAGSDCHCVEEIGQAGIIAHTKLTTEKDLTALFYKGQPSLYKKIVH